ncbi:MAG TPA: 3',5'-cyclic-nucleotide phosphodiesterase [Deltaproteobacteria bacterium]|jgi:ribonuclease BN (tRNA processing enzyme)|nr:3',5'-cyclic-nucleotide phosphodiesterase [Deltaproteobacteria bacterium]MDI9542328.1 3',5'-cyclic-nucleotide phosphodiesterase [Pseudomonadota bacterium]NLW66300.1 3',5'-cyclic-nucleotide phosphodiesterase [Bacteriovoracaceae bacterium]HRR21416.1 3',5'-cyclic-nucleotide phosphodiesterase [Desulfomonilia bacterium]HOD69855.1 3',5'-cyclic-nucleotide phosphodiesterase [Deltaproteobacteria bacterium]
MRIEILGCSGAVMQGYNTTSILINRDTLIDAGSVSSVLPEEEVRAIRHILITHPHIDHIKELPFVLDTLFSSRAHEVAVWASGETLKALTENVFNGMIWPEIRDLNAHKDFISLREVPEGEFAVGGLKITGRQVDHIPGSLCYQVSEENGSVIFSGDTGYDQRLFDLALSLGDNLKALFVEVSFPDRMEEIARLSRHLTPLLLKNGIDGRLGPSVRVIAYHIKPKYLDEVVAELPPNVAYIVGGEVFEF